MSTPQRRRLKSAEVLARREYLLTNSRRKVLVQLGKPRKIRGQKRFEWPVEIDGKLYPVNGADAFEALQLAIIMIGTDLKHIDESFGVIWPGHERGDLGFPAYPDYSLSRIIGR
jgi:hypothetical protein